MNIFWKLNLSLRSIKSPYSKGYHMTITQFITIIWEVIFMEIERKFLTGSLPFTLENFPYLSIEQSYISTFPTIRLRKSNDDYILTIKGNGGIAREEFELALSKEQYNHLSQKSETPLIIKKRYLIPLSKKLTAELDVYTGHLEGLSTIEVEFDSIEEANSFIPPNWFGKDVTFDHRYKNTSLSIDGIPK